MAGRRESPTHPTVRSPEERAQETQRARRVGTFVFTSLLAAGTAMAIYDAIRDQTIKGITADACAELVGVLEGMALEDADKERLCTNALIKSCLGKSDLCKGEEE